MLSKAQMVLRNEINRLRSKAKIRRSEADRFDLEADKLQDEMKKLK